ncbi:hypothetical protein TH53_17335 [Pedobacter lusitanus]|uniref:Carboxypeptidase-like regulatory domain-containing protein n=1 Tax=Pedobacter lusitanus TaxID=1503925 RepID=A0A0D0GFK8_9SPHI|nr:hypothetical protein [Pedobacter lusitanus]KIO76092.1 hypothetical protein TH53_17335 [Pedobacter lusitanus]
MKYIFAVVFIFFTTGLFAQQTPSGKKLIQFSGIITDRDSGFVVPYVTITNKTNQDQRYAANYKGYFSFVAHPGDTLIYNAIGYTDKVVLIPSDVKDSKYTAMVKMKSDIIYLPAVRIYPWATVEEFTKDFLAMKVADDDMEIARKNMSSHSINGKIQYLPRDAGEISSTNFRIDQERALNKNMVQTNPLLNPFAWGKLMQQIFSGDKSRQMNNN